LNKWLIAQFPKQITPFPSSMWEANGASHVPSLPLQWPGTTPNWSCHVMCTVEVPGQIWFLFTNFLKHDAFSLSLFLSLRVCNSESCGRWLCIATVSHSYKQQSIDRYKKPCRADVWGTHILLMPTSPLVNLDLQPIAKLSGDSGPWWYRWWLQGDIRSLNNLVLGHSNKGFCLDHN